MPHMDQPPERCCPTAACAAATSSCSFTRSTSRTITSNGPSGFPATASSSSTSNCGSTAIQSTSYVDSYRDNFPAAPNRQLPAPALDMLENHVVDGEMVVPPGFLFAMGDNRDDSADSRYWGFVPRENIVGTPVIIYWSYDAPTQDLTNGNIGFDHIVDVVAHFLTKTRWSRTFHLIRGYPLR